MVGRQHAGAFAATLDSALARSEGSALPATVVGCGNWLERTDRLGPRVLDALRGRLGPEVELVDVGTTLLGLIDRLRGQELVVLVDACVGRAAPGTVLVSEPDLEPTPPLRPTLHQIGPLDTLAVVRELYPDRLPGRIVLVAIETGDLQPEAEAEVVARALAVVEDVVASWRRERASARAARHRNAGGAS